MSTQAALQAPLIVAARAAAFAAATRASPGHPRSCGVAADAAATAAVEAIWESPLLPPSKREPSKVRSRREQILHDAEEEAERNARALAVRLWQSEACGALGRFLLSSDEEALHVFGHLKLGERVNSPSLDADKLRSALKALQRFATRDALDMASASLVAEAKAKEILRRESIPIDAMRIRREARVAWTRSLDLEEAETHHAKQLAETTRLREETERLTALRLSEQNTLAFLEGAVASLSATKEAEERSFAERKAAQEASLKTIREEQEAALKAAKDEQELALKAAREEQEAALKAARDEQESALAALRATIKEEEARQLEQMKAEAARLQALIQTRM